MTNFAQRLMNARKDKGLTQEQLGDLMNISRQAVGHWESGRSVPDVDTIRRIAAALGCEIEVLLPEEDLAAQEAAASNALKSRAACRKASLICLISGLLIGCLIGILIDSLALPDGAVKKLLHFSTAQAQLSVIPGENPTHPDAYDLFDGGTGYLFDFVITNESDVPFEVSKLYMLFYVDDTIHSKIYYPEDEIAYRFGGEMLTRDSIPVHVPMASNQMEDTSATLVVQGVDANGNELTFEGSIAFDPTPAGEAQPTE